MSLVSSGGGYLSFQSERNGNSDDDTRMTSQIGTQNYLSRAEWNRSAPGNLPDNVQGTIWMHMQNTHFDGPKLHLRFLGDVIVLVENDPLYQADFGDFDFLINQLQANQHYIQPGGKVQLGFTITKTKIEPDPYPVLLLKSHDQFNLLAMLRDLGHEVLPGDGLKDAYLLLRYPQPESYWNTFGNFTGPDNFVSYINSNSP